VQRTLLVMTLAIASLFNSNALAIEPLKKTACYLGECFTAELLATCEGDPTAYFDKRVVYRAEYLNDHRTYYLLDLVKLRDMIITNQNHTLQLDIDLKIFSIVQKVAKNSTSSSMSDRTLREAIELLIASRSNPLLIPESKQLKLDLLLKKSHQTSKKQPQIRE